MSPDLLFALGAMAVVTYLCRAAGYFAMGYVPLTPRIEAWLESIPIATLGAVLAPALANGGLPELAGFAVALVVMRQTGHDFLAAGCAVAVVAIGRALI